MNGQDILVLNAEEARGVRFESHDEHTPMFSPDGRWLAYVANESGPPEVYVMPFPGGGGSKLVSVGGGSEPLWSPRGGELFYRSGDAVMAVPYDEAAASATILTPAAPAS